MEPAGEPRGLRGQLGPRRGFVLYLIFGIGAYYGLIMVIVLLGVSKLTKLSLFLVLFVAKMAFLIRQIVRQRAERRAAAFVEAGRGEA